MEYYSDASYDSDLDHDSDDDEEPIEIYDERDVEYWELEKLFEARGPPPVIEYVNRLGAVEKLGCIVSGQRFDIESVVGQKSVRSWKVFWSSGKNITAKNPMPGQNLSISTDEWDAIGEFCHQMVSCVFPEPTMREVKTCMINVLAHGSFIQAHAKHCCAPPC